MQYNAKAYVLTKLFCNNYFGSQHLSRSHQGVFFFIFIINDFFFFIFIILSLLNKFFLYFYHQWFFFIIFIKSSLGLYVILLGLYIFHYFYLSSWATEKTLITLWKGLLDTCYKLSQRLTIVNDRKINYTKLSTEN